MIEAFVFSQNQSYVCVFFGRRCRHLRPGHPDRSSETLAGSPWTAGMIANREIVVVQSFDTMFVFHKDFETRQIVRTGAATFSIVDHPVGLPRHRHRRRCRACRCTSSSAATPRCRPRRSVTGPATITANHYPFAASDVGTWMLIYQVQCYITGFTGLDHVTVNINGVLPNTNPTVD